MWLQVTPAKKPVARHAAAMFGLGLGCVKTLDERTKCQIGSTVEFLTSTKSMD
jgi:hypothetical protein